MADTTEKFEARRAIFLERLIRAWDQAPHMRLGELIVASLDMSTPFDVQVLGGIDDLDLAERITRYILMRAR